MLRNTIKTRKKLNNKTTKIIQPIITDINVYISSFGIVKPRNRITVKPSIAGRLEKIFVKEGEKVKHGQILAKMSSIERATLLDATLSKDKNTQDYWKKAYKPISIISPIHGEVIAQLFEPGQVISITDTILVISDKLIVVAQVDETDIGKTKIGQKVNISLDAYPNKNITGKVTHISYESRYVNNVTIYEVEITLNNIPSFFRSGMSANIDILMANRKQVLAVPIEAIRNKKNKKFILVKSEKKVIPRIVKTGLSDDKYSEIISGVTLDDEIIIKYKKYALKKKKNSPWGRKSKSKKNKK